MGTLTPLPAAWRCTRHNTLQLGKRICPLCAAEERDPEHRALPALRGERIEDHDGRPMDEKCLRCDICMANIKERSAQA